MIDLASALTMLERQGWFSRRSKDVRARLANIAKLRRFRAGEHLYTIGDRPNGMFGMIEGRLGLSIPRADGEDYTAHRVGSCYWFGDLALFAKGPRLMSVHAIDVATAVHLPSTALIKLVKEDLRLYEDFYELTYQNMELAFRVISNLAITSSTKRLADRLLLELANQGDDERRIMVSQSDLSVLTAISLPTIKRILMRFAATGVIRRRYGYIQILDPEALVRLTQR